MCRRLFSAFLFAVVSLVSASSPDCLLAQAPGGSITGHVRVAPGNELKSPVMVTLESRGAAINSIYTDSEGQFGFNRLPANLYHVVINEQDYQRIEESVAIDPINSSARLLTIYLVPLDAKKEALSTV